MQSIGESISSAQMRKTEDSLLCPKHTEMTFFFSEKNSEINRFFFQQIPGESYADISL